MDEPERGHRAAISEKPPARTENKWMDEQRRRVDEVVLHEGLHELATAEHHHVPIRPSFDPRDGFRHVALEQRRVRPWQRLSERCRRDALLCVVHGVGEGLSFCWARTWRSPGTRGGFRHDGWALPYNDPVMGEVAGEDMARGGAIRLGRRTLSSSGRPGACMMPSSVKLVNTVTLPIHPSLRVDDFARRSIRATALPGRLH